jgi:hypothetical protein
MSIFICSILGYNSSYMNDTCVRLNHVYFITVTSSHQSLHVLSHRSIHFSPIGTSSGLLLYVSNCYT